MCDAPNREDAMVVLERAPDGTPTIWCDPCIATIVDALNHRGIRTVASCCGHRRRPGSIALADGREVLVVTHEQARELDALWPAITTSCFRGGRR